MQLTGPPKINGWTAPMPSYQTPMEGEWREDEDLTSWVKYRDGSEQLAGGEKDLRGEWRVVWRNISYDVAMRILYEVGAAERGGTGIGGSEAGPGKFLWTPRTRQPGDPRAIDVDGDGVVDIVLEEVEIPCRLVSPQPSTSALYRMEMDGTRVATLELRMRSTETYPERAGFGVPQSLNFSVDADSGDEIDFELLDSSGDPLWTTTVAVTDTATSDIFDVIEYPTDLPYTFADSGSYAITIIGQPDFSRVQELIVDTVTLSQVGPGVTGGLDLSGMTDLSKLTLRVDDESTIDFPESTWDVDVLVVSIDSNRRKEYYNTPGTSRISASSLSGVRKINCQILEGVPADIPSGVERLFIRLSEDFGGDTANGLGTSSLIDLKDDDGTSANTYWRTDQLKDNADLETVDVSRGQLRGDIHLAINNCPNLYSWRNGRSNTGDLRDSKLTQYPPLETLDLGFGDSFLDFGFTNAHQLTSLTFYRHACRARLPLAKDDGLLLDDSTTWDKPGSAGEELKAFHKAGQDGKLKSGLTLDVVQWGQSHTNGQGVHMTLLEDICWRVLGLETYWADGLLDAGVSINHDSLWGNVTVTSFTDTDSDGDYEEMTVQLPTPDTADTQNSGYEIGTTQVDSNGARVLVWEDIIQAGNVIRLRDTNGDVAQLEVGSVTNNGDGTATIVYETAPAHSQSQASVTASNVDEASALAYTYTLWDGIA